MSKLHWLLFSSSLIACIPVYAYADEEDTQTIPQIVVSATRSPTDITKIASSMTVITAEDIERKHKPTVADLLREVPGVVVAGNGGIGQTSRVFMRGTNSNHVLVIVDGVSINDPSDPSTALDFSNLPTDNIERIEVLRGAQSTLYGSQAIGGVINIISKQGKGRPKHSFFTEYGRYNTSKSGLSSSGEIGRTAYSAQVSYLTTDGVSSLNKTRGGYEKDGSDALSFATNLSSKLSETFTAKMNLRYNRTVTQFDSLGSSIPRPADDSEPENDSRQFTGRIAGELSLMDGKWIQELGIGYLTLNRALITEYFDAGFAVHFGRRQFHGWRESMDWIHRVALSDKHKLTFGVEGSRDHFAASSVGEKNSENVGLFIDDQYEINDNWFVNAGVRNDRHSAFGGHTTWKVAPGYRINSTGTTIKASYGTGFKAPSLSQLYDTASANPNLQPEESKGWDVGFEQVLMKDKVSFGATIFRNDITNLIGFSNTPPFPAINTGKARTQGVESFVTLRPSHKLTLNATHTYTQADNRVNEKQLARRPKHTANADLVYRYNSDGDVGLNVRYVGTSTDIDFAAPFGRVQNKSFATVNLSTNYRVNPNTTVYGRVDNLLDKRYEEVYGYGQYGASATVGMKLNF
ncbi:MAG: TonB-dependent receptor plug domain-containing protein [Rickettsiales bacterium]